MGGRVFVSWSVSQSFRFVGTGCLLFGLCLVQGSEWLLGVFAMFIGGLFWFASEQIDEGLE
jgi:hypothetical protein